MKKKLLPAAVALAAFTLLLSAPAPAQWLNFKTPGIPRTPDGKADLSAPLPRTPDGKPDLSGIWRAPMTVYGQNIAADLKTGDVQPWAEQVYQQRVLNLGADSPRAHCLPDPPPFYHAASISRIVQTSNVIMIVTEGISNSSVFRTIHTDGRGLPEDPNPSWLGYSVGHWDGDTMVVTTAGFNDRSWLDGSGHPHTEALRTTERFHRRDFGHMDFEMTIDDPTGFRLTPEVLSKYAGTYEFAPGRPVIVTSDGDVLFLQRSANGPKEPFAAQSDTVFLSRGNGEQLRAGDRLEFVKGTNGAITQFVLHLTRAGDQKALRKSN